MLDRVLLLTFTYPPSSEVGGFRLARFAKFLPQFGWTPFVATAASEESTLQRDDARLDWTEPSTVVVRSRNWDLPRSWKVWRRPAGKPSEASQSPDAGASTSAGRPPSSRGSLHRLYVKATMPLRIPDKRIWWAVPALRSMRRIVREYRPSVVLSSSPPHSSHVIAMMFKAMTGIPVVIDLRDPWARNRSYGGEGRIVAAIQSRLERFCVGRADGVILNTPELLADFQQTYPKAWRHKFSAIPNGYDPAVRESIEALVRSMPARPPDVPLRLCHAGTVYGRRDIRPLIEAVARLNRQGHRVEFEQVGSLVNAAEVAECVARNDAGQAVRLLGQRPHDEALRRMAAADILVVVRQNTALQIPAKVYEMMLFGKPILALDTQGALVRMVRDYQLGVVADPVDPAAIATGILQAAEQGAAPASEGRERALRDFDSREQTRQLAGVLAAAAESKGRRRR